MTHLGGLNWSTPLMPSNTTFPPCWQAVLAPLLEQPYMLQLKSFLQQQKKQKKIIYPHSSQWFAAFHLTLLAQVKIVILGQDPYHAPGQAHGLCFSVPKGVAIPPSLVNIYRELHTDVNAPIASHGNLEEWAKQGVLLLNAILTVERNQAASHRNRGWEQFTDEVIRIVSTRQKNVAFLLWGRYAQSKATLIDDAKHCILTAAHPSPLSAAKGFLGCRHFSRANEFLRQTGSQVINWQLSDEATTSV